MNGYLLLLNSFSVGTGLTAIHFAAQSDAAPAIELIDKLLFDAYLKTKKPSNDTLFLPEITQKNNTGRYIVL